MRPIILFLVIQVLFSFSSFASEVTSSDAGAQEYVDIPVKKSSEPTLEEIKKQEIEARKLAQKKTVKPQCTQSLAQFQKIIEKQGIAANYPKNINKLLKNSHWKSGKKAFKIGVRRGQFTLSTAEGISVPLQICSGNKGVFTANFNYYGARKLAVKTHPEASSKIRVFSADPAVQGKVGGNYHQLSGRRYRSLVAQLKREQEQSNNLMGGF